MAKQIIFVVFFLLLSAVVASAQQFYQWKDGKGLWNYSNNRPAGVTEEQVKVRFYPPTPLASGDPFNHGYQEGYTRVISRVIKSFTSGVTRKVENRGSTRAIMRGDRKRRLKLPVPDNRPLEGLT